MKTFGQEKYFPTSKNFEETANAIKYAPYGQFTPTMHLNSPRLP